ncbi:MAG TPA: metal-dependent hydrolase [Candidatus Acidoferrales bacterium]|nr:metal-dependent hydrolase [Candidatus Acidoferrales bacterium]
MDPITHGITGALIGKGFFSRRHARVAIFAATLGAIFPDVDIFMGAFSNDPLRLARYHRGFTHSFLGLLPLAAVLAWLTRLALKWFTKSKSSADLGSPSFGALFLIYTAGIGSHILLDATTSFGTRLWNPLSGDRVAWDFLFIIDFTFTSLVLLPQVTAWIYKEARGWLIRAAAMWALFTVLAFGVCLLARAADFSFSPRIVVISSLIFAALFFLPARNGFGIRFGRTHWCRAGFCVACSYILICGFAHRAALARVRSFASSHRLAVEKLGALPLPPSLLEWNGLIETPGGVYQSEFSLLDSAVPAFRFLANSPANLFTEKAARLKPVRTYLWFARFPVMRFMQSGDTNIVEYADPRFFAGASQETIPFSFEVRFDSRGNAIDFGWIHGGLRFPRARVAPDSSDTSP